MKREKIEKVIQAAIARNFIKGSDLDIVVHNVEIEIEENTKKAIDKLENTFLEDLLELLKCTTVDIDTQKPRLLTAEEVVENVESMFMAFTSELDDILNE